MVFKNRAEVAVQTPPVMENLDTFKYVCLKSIKANQMSFEVHFHYELNTLQQEQWMTF